MSEKIGDVDLYRLVELAECGNPDNRESAGALMLLSVRDVLAETVEHGELTERSMHEIADGAPDVYTHQRWLEFVDLAAYNEDLSEYVGKDDDMNQRAGLALYLIAERLVTGLVREFVESEVLA